MPSLKRLFSAFLVLAQLATPSYAAGFDGLSGLNSLLNVISSVSGAVVSLGEAQRAREAEAIYRPTAKPGLRWRMPSTASMPATISAPA